MQLLPTFFVSFLFDAESKARTSHLLACENEVHRINCRCHRGEDLIRARSFDIISMTHDILGSLYLVVNTQRLILRALLCCERFFRFGANMTSR